MTISAELFGSWPRKADIAVFSRYEIADNPGIRPEALDFRLPSGGATIKSFCGTAMIE